jgi:hypothetical protein
MNRSLKFLIFFPFRFYLIAFVLFSLIGQKFLLHQLDVSPSVFNDILIALLRLIKIVLVPLIAFAFLSAFIPFLMLWISYRRRNLHISLTSPESQPEGLQQELQLKLHPVWQPILGHLYYRMEYDNGLKHSPVFSLVRRENKLGFAGSKQEGWFRWPLPGIRLYDIDTLVISMEDFFHFFRFALPVKVHQSFITRPSLKPVSTKELNPSTSQSEEVRIKDWRKVQGELLQYKNFDSSDDVRRIVWKIYAKNKELVVRTPEILNPYASHINIFISFFDGLGLHENRIINESCLDFFKAACFSFYSNLQKQGLPINFTTDQTDHIPTDKTITQKVEFQLAVNSWQNKIPPKDLPKVKQQSLICISSLISCKELEHLAASVSNNCTIALVPLSRASTTPSGWQWLRSLWIETENEAVYRFPIMWHFSKQKRQLVKNEKEIEELLKESGKNFMIIQRQD